MADNAIGLIQTKGYAAALAAGDAMVKAANVIIVGREGVGDGLVSVTITGGVGAVKAGAETALTVGELVSVGGSTAAARRPMCGGRSARSPRYSPPWPAGTT